MNFADIVFIPIVAVTLAGALVAVLARTLVYALVGLVVTMFGIAGLYIYLDAPFLAMMQILVYVGAISILVGFAIMLVGQYQPEKARHRVWKFVGAAMVAIVAFVTVAGIEKKGLKIAPFARSLVPSTKDIGALFFNLYSFPFELISLLIIVSIMGAVMLALLPKKGGK